MSRLPDDVKNEALAYVYAEFDRRKWEQVPSGDRGAVYAELIADVEESVAWLAARGIGRGDRILKV
mgnify:CR=1 FL=1